ncbi:MAG: hypothetical protein HY332_06800 [Chloroflexi bacterium]|nr:hypothetical protein [Chloroflexota bacterium]
MPAPDRTDPEVTGAEPLERPASTSPSMPEVSPADSPAAAPHAPPEPSALKAPSENPFRYWLRPLILAILVIVLLFLRRWDERRVPDRPARPTVQLATPVAGSAVSAADPALVDALHRLRTALQRNDARALSNLADPEGIIAAGYDGDVPESGYVVRDTSRLSQEILAGGRVSIVGWRSDGRGRVIVLAVGWPAKPLRLSANNTLGLTDVAALGLVSRGGTWYWRWLLPDVSERRILADQARNRVWQPLPS